MGEALVVAKVQVRLRAVIRDENLAMLKRAHRPRIHVQIGIEFQEGDAKPARLEQTPDRGRGQALPERADYTSGHKDVLGTHTPPRIKFSLWQNPNKDMLGCSILCTE